MFAESLSKFVQNYTFESAKPFSGSEFGNFVRHELAQEARKQIPFGATEFLVKGSVGAGNWAAVPWLAFFHPLETESATKGTYVVYLVDPIHEQITLSMNQGATSVVNEYGDRTGRRVLRRRAQDIFDRVSDFAGSFSDAPIDFASGERLPKSYEAGHSFGRTYKLHELNETTVAQDLHHMLMAYQALIERGGTISSDEMIEASGSSSIEEARLYVMSRRIERSPKIRRAVLAVKAPVCEACGLEPRVHYAFFGKREALPLDVHHSRPLFKLSEGERKSYRVPDDFLVLCPTCHRMIHHQENPADLGKLKSRLQFKLSRT